MVAKKKASRTKATKKGIAKNTRKPTARTSKDGLNINVSPKLEARLEELAKSLGKSMDQLLAQALNEFVDTWEDHQRVLDALDDGDDRVQIVVGKD